MDDTAGIPLLHSSQRLPAITKIVDATHVACRDLLRTNSDNAGMDPEAVETVLGLIGLWGIPVLDLARLDPERTWLWADLHLRDAASVRCHRRPFWCRQTHDRALRGRWRRTVAPTDLMIHAGDFAPESVGERNRRALLDALPGRKVNVLGNHDVAAMDAPLTEGWDASFGALIIASAPPLIVTHCPLRTVPAGTVNIHGHMHRRRDRRDDPRINITVEQTGYRPVPASALVGEAARRLARRGPRTTRHLPNGGAGHPMTPAGGRLRYATLAQVPRPGRTHQRGDRLTGWIVPVTDRTRPTVRICTACERRDPFMAGIEDATPGCTLPPGTAGTGPRSTPANIPGHAETRHD